ncbi:DinB family protein [Streptomyces sp. NPDC050439]|uniref:DinB family protein n=1 Tax=unclassified Streptomyces TaxID=2593676 RepID=UPI003420088A
MDTNPLRRAYEALLEAAATVADSPTRQTPPPGAWNADQILAHVTIVNALTSATAATISAGAHTTFENRIAQDTWTIERAITYAGGNTGLRERIRTQAELLCALGEMLSDAELDTLVPTLLLSNDTVMVDQMVPLRNLITGLAENELPGHSNQLLALLPNAAAVAVAAAGTAPTATTTT